MSRTVFISHSSHDRAIGDQICRFLEGKGVPCWIAPRDVMPGKNYGTAIVEAIDECKVFLLVLSGSSNKSQQVVREVERAASSESIIIPFRIEDVQPSRDLEFYVSAAHWLDASTKPLEKHLRELLKAIEDWQKTGAAPEERTLSATRRSAVVAAKPSAAPPFEWKLPALVIAIVIAAAAGAVALYSFHHRAATAPSIAAYTPAPSPDLSSAPSASVASAAETPEITPMPTIAAAETTTPTRLRPGEPLRMRSPSESPEVSSSPQSPARLRPGQPLTSPNPPSEQSSVSKPFPTVAPPVTPAPAAGTVPLIREVIASSEWRDEKRTHRPGYAFDGNPATAWVPERGADGPSITAHFKTPTTIRTVSILCGNPQEPSGTTNRVKQVRVTLSDGANQVFSLADENGMHGFRIDHAAPVEWIRLEIVDVYRGAKAKITPIAEIAFNRDVGPEPAPASSERPKSGSRRRHSPPPKPGY